MEELVEKGLKDLDIMLQHGTTTVEIKSGYGLDEENESKILNVIKELQKKHPMTIAPTFLAHKIPKEYQGDRTAYLKLIASMLPKFKHLAEFCDVFCDIGAFSYHESRYILQEAKRHGYKTKIHAEQLRNSQGSEIAAELSSTSADHLDYITEKQMALLKDAGVVAVLLPCVAYHLTELIPGHKAPKYFLPETVRKIIQKGLRFAVATDYNPGSSNTQSMKTVMEAAARLFRMNNEEIINAATINAAYALNRQDEIGSIKTGKNADLVIHDCGEHGALIDNFGINLVDIVIKNGKIVVEGGRKR